jgi:isoleucyl-tRNA synthetase
MDQVRDVSSAALSLRKARSLRVRLPLPSLTVAHASAQRLGEFTDLIADEVNVKEVVLSTDLAAHCQQVLTVVPRVLGPRVGGAVQQVIKAVKAGDWSMVDGAPTAADVTLQEGEYELRLVAADGEHSAALPGESGVVVLNTTLTPELTAEGLARDVVRVVQQARRTADLAITDRIDLVVSASPEVVAASTSFLDFLKGETLAESVSFAALSEGFAGEAGDGDQVLVQVRRR